MPRFNDMATAQLSLEIPSTQNLPYSLLSLAMIDKVTSRLFLTAGTGWTTLDEFGTTSVSMEAGMEQLFELSTLGGLLPLAARVGVATPVIGEGTTVFYWSLSF